METTLTKNQNLTAEKVKARGLDAKQKKTIVLLLQHFILILGCIVVLAPMVIIFFNSFKTAEEYIYGNVFKIPESFLYFQNYWVAFIQGKLLEGFKNSAILVVSSCFISILLGTMVAYALGRFEFKGKRTIMLLYTIAAIVPSITTQVATFSLIKGLGLYNTLGAGILLFSGTDLIQIYIYLQFIDNIPYALDESAKLDGASYLCVFRKIIFPLLKPATITVIIIKVISIYNDLYTAHLYMPKFKTISTALYTFSGENNTQWNIMSAAIILALIPTLIIFFTLQKYIYGGITTGSVKG